MSVNRKSSQSWFTRPKIIGTVATVVSCIVGLVAYFKPWDQGGMPQANTLQATTDNGEVSQSSGNQGNSIQGNTVHGNVTQSQTNVTPVAGPNVTATGNNPIAVGRDLNIERREVRNQYDAAPERAAAVKNYLQVAQDSCGKQASMISGLNKDSVIEMTSMPALLRSELYPTELVAEHLGEEIYGGIKSRAEAAQVASAGAMGLLMGNAVFKQTGMRSEPKPEQVAAFENGRVEWLKATNDLCGFINDVRRTHSL
jgi:hypothetical protein